MKKLLALLFSILMCFSLALAMTSCDDEKSQSGSNKESPEEMILGKWNLTYTVEEWGLSSEDFLPSELVEIVDISDFELSCIYEFKNNGPIKVYADGDSAQEFAEDVYDAVLEAYEEQTGEEMSKSDKEELKKITDPDVVKDSILGNEEIFDYEIDGDELIIDGDRTEFELSDKKLILVDAGDELVFTRK